MFTNSPKVVTTITLIIFLAGLFLFAYLGIYNRYWADDWCYNADLKELGLINTIKGYTYITTYASNRYSLTLFSGLFYYLGIFGVQAMSPLNIILLAAGMYWCLSNLNQLTDHHFSKISLVLLAFIAIYYTLYLAPHLYQSLYWRSGSLPYFEPIVMGVFIFALITYQSTRGQSSPAMIITVAIFSFLAGGFSESACAALTTALILYTSLAWFFRKQNWAKQALPVSSTALIATLIAMFFLISSPTTSIRVGLYGQPASLFELPFLITKFSYDFVKFSFTDMPIPHLALIGTSILLGYLLYDQTGQKLQARTVLIVILIAIVIAFIIITASFAPSAYIEKVPPHPRTRIIPRFILTSAMVFISWLLGTLARQVDLSKRFQVVGLLFFLLIVLYTTRSLYLVSQNIPVYSERAHSWDERASQMKIAIANGEDTLYVKAIDGFPVGGIRDFDERGQGRPGYWINQCAARYYGVDAVDLRTP